MSRRLEDELPALVYFLVVYYNILCVCVCSINGARRIRKSIRSSTRAGQRLLMFPQPQLQPKDIR
jgi:hypothetical protein